MSPPPAPRTRISMVSSCGRRWRVSVERWSNTSWVCWLTIRRADQQPVPGRRRDPDRHRGVRRDPDPAACELDRDAARQRHGDHHGERPTLMIHVDLWTVEEGRSELALDL